MEVVGLKVILKTTVAGTGGKQQMHTVPQEMEGRGDKGEVGQDAGVVVEVLSKKGLGFRVWGLGFRV